MALQMALQRNYVYYCWIIFVVLLYAAVAQQHSDEDSSSDIDYDAMELAKPILLSQTLTDDSLEPMTNQPSEQMSHSIENDDYHSHSIENDDYHSHSIENDDYHNQMRHLIEEELKMKLFEATGMNTSSNDTQDHHTFPMHLLDVDPEETPNAETESHVRISSIFSFAANYSQGRGRAVNHTWNSIVYFNIPDEVDSDNLDAASLLVYIRTPPGASGIQIEIDVGARKIPFELSHRGRWLRVDITDLYQLWLENSAEPSLRIYGEYGGENVVEYGRGTRSHSSEDESTTSRDPLIKLKVDQSRSTRRKRSVTNQNHLERICDPNDGEERCCRYRFRTTVEELGLNFIVYPTRIVYYYCEGVCPEYVIPSAETNQQTFHRSRCCTPTRKSPLFIVYYNKDGVLLTAEIDNMLTNGCGCQ